MIKSMAETFAEETMKFFPKAISMMAQAEHDKAYFVQKGMWPDWCALPMAATYAALCGQMGVEQLNADGVFTMSCLTAAYIWSKAKIIFDFDPALERTLIRQDFDGDIPWEALQRLPVPCAYIKLHNGFIFDSNMRADGFYAWLEYDCNACWAELRIVVLFEKYQTLKFVCPIKGTLAQSLKALQESDIKQAALNPDYDPVLFEQLKEMLKNENSFSDCEKMWVKVLNLLLYLCSDEPEYSTPPRKTAAVKGNSPLKHSASTTQNVRVGTRIGAELRKTAHSSSSTSTSAGQSGRTMPTHLRRAHWHHFWTGERTSPERKLKLKWIAPIIVNENKDEIVTTIRPVKEDKDI